MPVTKKAIGLYLASSIDELNAKAELPAGGIRTTNPKA